MTEAAAAPPPPPGLPPQPPALTRALALTLVTGHHLRLTDPRDSRLGELGAGMYELGAASWTGKRAVLVAFYTPPADPVAAGQDLAARCAAAARWGVERLHIQGAERCDVLIVALRALQGSLSAPPAPPGVHVGVIAVDPGTAEVTVPLPPPPGLLSPRDVRIVADLLRSGGDAPTLAAVDLAEREAVAGGYAAPARTQMSTQPIATYALTASFVVIYIIEKALFSSNQLAVSQSIYQAILQFPGASWWQFVSSAFLHDPNDILHILFNGLAMYWVGRLVEQLYGRLALVSTFLITAVGGGLLWVAWNAVSNGQGGATLGASGGITGLLGLLVVLGYVQGRNVPVGIAHAMRRYALTYGSMIVVFGFLIANVNNLAHVGGFITGALLGLVIPPLARVGGRDLALWERALLYAVCAAGGVALVVAAVNVVGAMTPSG
ncbi:MAG: rhomboid family intramembrane serine protease [Candidatus Dormibacter sp.]